MNIVGFYTATADASGADETPPQIRSAELRAEAASMLRSDAERAYRLASEAFSLSWSVDEKAGYMEADFLLAMARIEQTRFDEALRRLFDLLRQVKNAELPQLYAKVLRGISVCYEQMSMYTTALEYITKARSVAEASTDAVEEALCYAVAGDVYCGVGDSDKALTHYREAVRLLEPFDAEQRHRAAIFLNFAAAYRRTKGFRQATLYYEQSLVLFRGLQDTRGILKALSGMADVAAEQQRSDKALELLFTALDMAEAHSYRMESGQILFSMSEIYRAAVRPQKALEYALRAYHILQDSQAVALMSRIHQALAADYKALGNIEQAFSHFEQFHTLREQSIVHDSKRSLKHLQEGFAMEQAQKEAEIYRLRNVELAQAQQELERLLLNILPPAIAERLRQGENTIADRFDHVTVMFVDIVGFTMLSERHEPETIVQMLDRIFSTIDDIVERYGLEKIKTIGDAYMIASGIPHPRTDHAETASRAALDIVAAVQAFSRETQANINVRVGLHTGAVVAGVIGRKKFAYDLWGDTVNTASRMESHGQAGKVHISEAVYEALTQHTQLPSTQLPSTQAPSTQLPSTQAPSTQAPSTQLPSTQLPSTQAPSTQVTFLFEERGEIEVKGKGVMKTYFLTTTFLSAAGEHDVKH